MAIRLKPDHLEAIKSHGERTFPSECCGLLLGSIVDDDKWVQETYGVDNAKEAGTQHNRYLIPPEGILAAEKYARAKRLDIVGFYHSHPNAEARPSQFDLDHAWPFYSYVIVSVKQGKAEALFSWKMVEDRSRFDPEVILTL